MSTWSREWVLGHCHHQDEGQLQNPDRWYEDEGEKKKQPCLDRARTSGLHLTCSYRPGPRLTVRPFYTLPSARRSLS